jgi:hypothetical protein
VKKLSSKQGNKVEKTTEKKSKKIGSNIIGLMLLLATASIFYSTTVIIMGTDGLTPIIMVVPQAILAVVILVYKFCK